MKIPGFSFSLKRAVGITAAKQKFARSTGIPTSRAGLERKVGAMVLGAILGGRKKRKVVIKNESKAVPEPPQLLFHAVFSQKSR